MRSVICEGDIDTAVGESHTSNSYHILFFDIWKSLSYLTE